MAFWVENASGASYTIDDLGMTLLIAEERDLHLSVSYEALQESADLLTALTATDLNRLDGPGGSVIPVADAFDDATSEHQLGGDAHTVTTLTELNTLLSDADLDDSSDSRPPNLHASSHRGGGGDAIDTATQSLAGLLSAADKVKIDGLSSGNLYVNVRNETGSSIAAGKIVAAAGWSVANSSALVVVADKDNGDARPAIGVLTEALADSTNGSALIAGKLEGFDTSSWAVTDQLVLGSNGDFSRPPPDEDPFTGEVQNVGSVIYVDASDGIIQFIPDGMNPVTAAQVFALIGSDGTPSKTNPYVTDTDTRLTTPAKTLRVSASGGDYTSVKTAIDAAITAGASASNPYSIIVYPGSYTEDPMTMQVGIEVTTVSGSRVDSATIVANNSAQDLFTCTGGTFSGLECVGVTDASKALFRMSTASTLTVLHGIALKNCSTGVAISNGATVVATDFAVNIDGAGVGVTTALSVTGSGSYLGIVGGFFSVPAAVLPAYSVNPIQTVLRVADQAEVFITGITARIANKDTTADTLLADGGSRTTLMASEVSGCYRGARIGSSGTGTEIIVTGAAFFSNTINGQSDSATGVFLVNAATDTSKLTAVPGTVLSGMLQLTDSDRSVLAGNLSYQFAATGQSLLLEDWFHDQSSTGVAYPETTLVTAGTGLNVSVAAGHGYVSRHTPYHDSFNVEWDAGSVALTASTTNYVGYNSATSALASVTSLPGPSFVLLATVVTDGSGIRFIHRTRALAHDTQSAFQEYLEVTRKIILKSGLAVTEGSTSVKFEVDSGEWYRSIDIIPYTGTGTDASWSYFYGTNGATEVASQTSVDTTQYDNAGTLTNMTASYYRSDTVLLTSDGRISVIYGTEEFATEALAIATDSGSTPTFMEESAIRLARLIVQQGNDITSIVDERPVGTVSASGGSGGVTVHADLAGLSADDHSQYLLASGSRAMAGDLNMGSNDISSVGTVDGVDVSAHASRHAPGGSDALTTGTPVAIQIGASPAVGTGSSVARNDHQHGIATGTPGAVGTANAEGSSSSVARLDHVHSGLTRGAADFAAFTTKGTPTTSDVILIEDAADSNNKKKTTIGDLPSGIDTTAIHKATAAEISAMTAKTTPVAADVFVIEDSADSFSKKKVTLTNVLSQNVFGTEAQNEESLGTSSTTSTAWQNKVTLTTPSLPAGTYRIGWSCEMNVPSTAQDIQGRVQVDATTTIGTWNIESKDASTYYPLSGYGYLTLTAASRSLTLDYSSENGTSTSIRNARLEIWRVS